MLTPVPYCAEEAEQILEGKLLDDISPAENAVLLLDQLLRVRSLYVHIQFVLCMASPACRTEQMEKYSIMRCLVFSFLGWECA